MACDDEPGSPWCSDGHQLGRRVRLGLGGHLPRWQDPGGLAAAGGTQTDTTWPWVRLTARTELCSVEAELVALFTRVRIERVSVFASGPDDNPNESRRDSLRSLLELNGIIGIVLYAFAWLETVGLFSVFHLSPEDVGIAPTFLLIRAGFTALPIIGLVLLLYGLRLLRDDSLGLYHRLLALLTLGIVIFMVYNVWWTVAHGSSVRSAAVWLISTIAGFVTLIALVLGSPSKARSSIIAIGAVVWITLTLLYGWLVGLEAADRIMRNFGYVHIIPPEIPVLIIPPVQVFQSVEPDGPRRQIFECSALLGTANGVTTVLGDDHRVWRLPTDQIAIVQGCISSEDADGS
jgi:hypothetical protein